MKFPRKLMITYCYDIINEDKTISHVIARAFIPVLEPFDDVDELLTSIEDVANQSITERYERLSILGISDLTELLKEENND